MPCFLKNLPPLGYTFYLRDAMIIAPQTQYFCILCTQKPRERIELPPVSWTTKLKSKKQEAFHVRASGIKA